MAKAVGIGGLFFRSLDTKALAAWYETHLGVTGYWDTTAGMTVFAPFKQETDYFPSDKQWMINFRVRDLEKMAAQLRAAGIEVKVDPQAYPYGRFARLHDPEGNPIELWQPMG